MSQAETPQVAESGSEQPRDSAETQEGQKSGGFVAMLMAWFQHLGTTWDGRGLLLALIFPAIYYTIMVPVEITFGDGPELLMTVYHLGVIHPSGYPLYTILGWPFVHLPGPSEHWNLVFFLSVIPTLVTCGLMYAVLRRVGAAIVVAVPIVWLFAFNSTVLPLATRVEVYALHGMLVAMSIYWLLRFSQEPERMLWARLATMALGLALCNHLTSVFWFPGLALGLVLINWRKVLHPKQLGILFGIGALCGCIYFYLPLTSILHDPGDTVLWNQPDTWDRFWYHVLGKEYEGFRKFKTFWRDLQKFGRMPGRVFFPGILVLAILGLLEGLMRYWRFTVAVTVFVAFLTWYVVIYQIGDINTYYGPLFFAGIIYVGVGTNWLLNVRLPEEWKLRKETWIIALVVLCSVPVVQAYRHRGHIWQDVMAQDMSDFTLDNLPPKTMVFTIVDGHTFPMWYQAFIKRQDENIVTVDRVMFRLKDKKWYRDFLRGRYPEVTWPTEEQFNTTRGVVWEKWLIDKNKDRYTFAALLANPWTVKDSYPINKGWHHEIVLETDKKKADADPNRNRSVMHIYMAKHHRIRSRTYFYDNEITYESGKQSLVCVVEWWKHSGLKATWTIRGPNNTEIKYKPHAVPKNSNISWEAFPPEKQFPGEWSCEVEKDGKKILTQKFTLTAP